MELGKAVVRAAGGIITREGAGAGVEVLLVHRPRYDDWTFPKGKAKPGESDETCALREVEEETGLRCAIGGPAGESSYIDPQGRPKVVRYFAMRPIGGQLFFLHEVDRGEWHSVSEAVERLTYEHDRDLLRAFTRAS